MIIIDILLAIGGLAIGLFLPGYLVTLLLFKKLDLPERIFLAILFSACIDIAIAVFLGYNLAAKNFTGGMTQQNVWIYNGSLTIILASLLVLQRFKEKRRGVDDLLKQERAFKRFLDAKKVTLIKKTGVPKRGAKK